MAGPSPAKTKADAAILHSCRRKIFPGQPCAFAGVTITLQTAGLRIFAIESLPLFDGVYQGEN
jgi:hypothetical protein